jgi:hypothetical protein
MWLSAAMIRMEEGQLANIPSKPRTVAEEKSRDQLQADNDSHDWGLEFVGKYLE